ncbi:MAG: DM13 domain-containing protein [Burkholderiales bacterium]
MTARRTLLLALSHAAVAAAGFAGGIYALPILVAPAAPSAQEVRAASRAATWTGMFRRDLEDSDAFHWGEGTVSVTRTSIALDGKLAPGPDYKLYLSPQFVETEDDFKRLKPSMTRVGEVRTFENFVVALPPDVDPSRYTAVIVWCERFSQFITAAKYR